MKKQELISPIKAIKDKSKAGVSQGAMENKQLEKFFLHKPTDEIIKTVEFFSGIIKDTLGKDLHNIDTGSQRFPKTSYCFLI